MENNYMVFLDTVFCGRKAMAIYYTYNFLLVLHIEGPSMYSRALDKPKGMPGGGCTVPMR